MGGVNVDSGGKGGRKAVDSELNLIPMIDLFVVCVLFLIMTAVWSQMARIEANAQVPGPPNTEDPVDKPDPERMLTVEMKQDDRFVLIWKAGSTVHSTTDVQRKGVATPVGGDTVMRYPDLAKKIAEEWAANGSHKNADDSKRDQAIISVDNRTPFSDIVAVIDAIYGTKRKLGTDGRDVNAFNVTFSAR
ncbi:MAG: biopolymer transporter ExbD [Polyangiaceae bacterium]|nr:biopolymer transporter ExbD [Polyangiaceae bacterium]